MAHFSLSDTPVFRAGCLAELSPTVALVYLACFSLSGTSALHMNWVRATGAPEFVECRSQGKVPILQVHARLRRECPLLSCPCLESRLYNR